MQSLIAILVAANLGLAAWLGFKWTSSQPPQVAAVDAPKEESPSKAGSFASRKDHGGMQIRQSKVSWESIASKELKLYVANLRSVGCPEETIKDLIIAEVNRRFAPREKALKIHQTDYNPWEAPVTQGREYYDRLKQIRNLVAEKRAVLKEALGVDVPVDIPTQLPNRTLNKYEDAFATLPEQKRDAVRSIQDSYWDKIDEIKKRSLGYLESADRDEINALKRERREALARVLTPQELLDFDLKTTVLADNMKNQLNGMAVSNDEFRDIFSRIQKMEQQLAEVKNSADADSDASRQRRKELDTLMRDQFKAVVGEARYNEFERSKDPVYQNLARAGEASGLPQASVLKAYEVQKALQDETTKLMANKAMPAEERQQSLVTMKQQASEALLQLMGQQAYQTYVKSTEAQPRTANRLGNIVNTPGTAIRVGETLNNIIVAPVQVQPRNPGNP